MMLVKKEWDIPKIILDLELHKEAMKKMEEKAIIASEFHKEEMHKMQQNTKMEMEARLEEEIKKVKEQFYAVSGA